jgi:erythromycin esterase-like protein
MLLPQRMLNCIIAMIRGDVQSWNIRDNHMMETLERLIAFHDEGNSKAIVWAHNTHIGDARATDMSKDNMLNLGQLVNERKVVVIQYWLDLEHIREA